MNPEAKADARTSIDHLLATLKAELAQPGKSLLPLLGVMSRFAKYSLANQLLIFAQRPNATHVQGYRAWNKAGHQVRKGEKGIAIYAPMLFAKRRDTDDPDTTDLSAAPRLGYRVAYVFDVALVDAISPEFDSWWAHGGRWPRVRSSEFSKFRVLGARSG